MEFIYVVGFVLGLVLMRAVIHAIESEKDT
jgi:energy-converting hydrogenase Eha subunit E